MPQMLSTELNIPLSAGVCFMNQCKLNKARSLPQKVKSLHLLLNWRRGIFVQMGRRVCAVINKHDSRAAFVCLMHDGNGCHIFCLVIQPKSFFFYPFKKGEDNWNILTRELGERDKTKLLEIKRRGRRDGKWLTERLWHTEGNFASKVPIVLNCNTRLCKSLPIQNRCRLQVPMPKRTDAAVSLSVCFSIIKAIREAVRLQIEI